MSEKIKSRKWQVTIWACSIVSIIVIIAGVSAFTGFALPDWLGVIATTLSTVPLAYIGGNVYQKTKLKEEKNECES